MKIFNLLLAAVSAQDFGVEQVGGRPVPSALAEKPKINSVNDLIIAALNGKPTPKAKLQEEVLAAGSARPVRAKKPKPETSFDKVRLIENYYNNVFIIIGSN